MKEKTVDGWAFEIWCWQYSNTDSFYNKLICCMSKADAWNQYALSKGFPNLGEAWLTWQSSESPQDFFNKFESTREVE